MSRLQVLDPRCADIRFQDGALPHAVGVKSFQILRASRAHPGDAEGFGWTYNHAPMLCHAFGRFYCQFLSNPVSEHEVPGHTLLCESADGMAWSAPRVLFPEIEVDTSPYRGPRSDLLAPRMLTVPHQRMGFYMASNGVLLTLSFYGLVHDRRLSMPCDGWGVGRAVRRIFPDSSLGDIRFLLYNEPAGFTRENTDAFGPWEESPDADFRDACRELLRRPAVLRQMAEEQRFDPRVIRGPFGEAFCWYEAGDGGLVGLYKKSLVSFSMDGGATWSPPEREDSIHTMSGKVWGQKTSDGRYALMYNPSSDGQHRWPIAIACGEDGYHFTDLLALTQEMSPQRYGGLDKNLGPQYLRGIACCNPQSPDGDIWLVYSNNKEDIWISRIPVPVTGSGALKGELDLRGSAFPRELTVYSPRWAAAAMDGGSLLLRDADPYDRAMVEFPIGHAVKGKVTVSLVPECLAPGSSVTLEARDDEGRTPVQLVFMPSAEAVLLTDGRMEPWLPFSPGGVLDVSLDFDVPSQSFRIRLGGEEKALRFSASVPCLSRLRLLTRRRIPRLSSLDDCGKYGGAEADLPGSEEKTGETRVRLLRAAWSCE